MSKLVIVDYGSGNLKSVQNAFLRSGKQLGRDIQILVSGHVEDVRTADRIVLPGVGSFADCMNGLKAIDGMVEVLNRRVIAEAVPFMGICVGMQLLATQGWEKTYTKGLDWISGSVRPIAPDPPSLKVPHMGWNRLYPARQHPLLEDFETEQNGLHVYFVHSYHFDVVDPAHVLATTEYGKTFAAIVGRDNLVATQFHPEKSQAPGLKLISNFLKWAPQEGRA